MGPRILAGPRGAVAHYGAINALALKLRDHARSVGLDVGAVAASRIACSKSRYLILVDGRRREWVIRVSNHFRPRNTGHQDPHLDFISTDGVSGFDDAAGYITRIAAGENAWWPTRRSPKRKGQR